MIQKINNWTIDVDETGGYIISPCGKYSASICCAEIEGVASDEFFEKIKIIPNKVIEKALELEDKCLE